MQERDDGRVEIPQIGADEIAARLGTDAAPMLLDVREPEEFEAWSIPGARNIPLGQLATRRNELPASGELVVVCASGARSSQAVAALRAQGVHAVNLAGGMQAWACVYDTVDLVLGPVTVVQVRRRGKGCLSYVVGSGEEAFVIDPSLDLDEYLQVAADRGWRISRVFDTHLHADHVSGARALAAAAGARLHLNPADPFDFAFEPLADGQSIPLGEGTTFSVTAFATPGHTRGSAVFDVGGVALLTGDTLFVDGVGRPDLADRAEEFARDLHRSLHSKVVSLPAGTLVLPSHHGESVTIVPGRVLGATIDELRRTVPQLTWSEEEFVRWAAGRATPRPPHYAEIVRINMGSGAASDEARRLELGPNRCSA